ncbi:MAG: LamB/YcsF family protein [Rhodocyclaceae bacterium]|nr:LamB/YcsF family protein [Rhodocyclaceae bacterium]MCW5616183.1 LamB/YcsF family protein [Rhodocyclaceae bacterium]
MQLNLNADLGESFGAWKMGDDEALLAIVDSANIACGFHAGDPLVMRNTVRAARNSGTSLGAHPAFPDLQGFGRRAMQMAPAELEAAVLYQLGALAAMAAAEGARLSHVKPHGALNNMACEDAAMADTVARAVKAFDPALILLAPVLSELALAGERAGLAVALEVFADRAYTERATLVPRREPGAVLHQSSECIAHVARMIEAGGVVATSGKVLKTAFHSICVHGDNAHAVATARQLRAALEAAGHGLHPLPALFGLPS